MAFALARWKKLNEEPSSGLRPLLAGQVWSTDYQGPYAVAAAGGFTGMFVFVCLSTGYGAVFLVKSKTELFTCVKKVNVLCNRHGHLFEVLRVDAGKVEDSVFFLEQCACINGKGKQYMSVAGDDGAIHLKSRGDSNILAKQFVTGENTTSK